jgi:hypothetical protein
MIDTATIEGQTAHRPWPKPGGPWIMFQSWRSLLFAHWALPAAALRSHVPSPLVLEEFDGSAWLGLTPFLLTGLHARGLPPLPGLSEFPEMNLRTYVRYGSRPGIFFFALDAANAAAVAAAKLVYRLPYRRAEMSMKLDGEWIRYRSRRVDEDAEFAGRYRPVGDMFEPSPGTLEHFLTERYALYTVLRSGRVLRGQIHHAPWRLRDAEVEIETNSVPAASGLLVGNGPVTLHYAERQDTLIWPPELADRR